ncbi:type ISP restriction/modification enzyme [Microbacterium paludicola]|uniref:type ISP restriction/modification enzyme n=1 Tax=Microbacterium paludicola TaxID=300019 RepID=UPI001431843F|nr:type ISP restriction/modification enzyme [Microbacterium paludicola]MBF0816070.1 DEAD/DEAH box helicase [Microbacterium paludicola]
MPLTFAPSAEQSDLELEFPLEALLGEFDRLADSVRMKGNYFEQLVAHYLKAEPLWADQLGAVWLWKDWPGRNGLPDTGIDIVAEIQGGGLLAVQAKFYAAGHKMQKGDLDSFFEALGREPFTEGLVIDTTVGDWSANAAEALKNRSKPVRRIGREDLRHSLIDWSSYELLKPEAAPALHERKTLRAHQHDAIRAVIEGLPADGGADRGKLIMACGTGKTFTALKLAERWTEERAGGAATVLFMVPSLALLQQTLDEWSREKDPELGFRAFAVGSDTNIGRRKNDDLTSVMMEDLGAPATTNGKRLAELLGDTDEQHDGLTVVFSTYQSIEAVAEAQRIRGDEFDLVICDEAHRTTGVTLTNEDESHFVKIHDNDFIAATKRVYMTATPRIFAPEVKNAAKQRDAELVSMDDEALYGEVLYRIGFDEAVSKGLLTDYKVVVLGISEDDIIEGLQKDLSVGGHELQITDIAKLVGCYNALAKRNAGEVAEGFGSDMSPMRRAVAFAKDIKTSENVAHDFEVLANGYLRNLLNDDPTDDLAVQAMHVDGTMNATQRGERLDWLKAAPEQDELGKPVARVLTNARCLSEGVDVPSLDAVLFLSPRKSQVDVVQAVGRVMRRAEGKRLGYIVLPIAIPAGISPEEALNDNERYKVVWQVLQALRAHDERLDAAIQRAQVTGNLPEQVLIERVSLTKPKPRKDSPFEAPTDPPTDTEPSAGSGSPTHVQPMLPGLIDSAAAWKDSVFAKLVAKVGDRMYWDDWAGDIGQIAQRFIALITAHINAEGNDRAPFEAFVKALRATVTPSIGEPEAIELLAQHLITKPVFEAMFPEGSFTNDNPVSVSMERVLETFHENAAFEKEREPLDAFYASVTSRIRGLDSVTAKQRMLVTLYDKFFSKAFPKLADAMGIVFTPVEVVDYILRSADAALAQHFGKHLSDEGVNILEPFVGTGTFLTRLAQTGLIKPQDLARKYQHELFANEIVLLSYYIAAVNIESVFRECVDQAVAAGELPEGTMLPDDGFPGISLTDTFAMDERASELALSVFPENTARVEAQRATPIDVIVMNPPYRAGQSSANEGAQNAKYSLIDGRIAATYAKESSGANKNGLYDSYYRALRWATDRLRPEGGVIAFVSNSGFIDGGTADGVRKTWGGEFSDVIVYNLRGNQRVKNWQAEGGKVFGEGSQTGVAITILVKTADHAGPARIHYADVGDYLSREEKIDRLVAERSIEGTAYDVVTPNEAGDWINQRDERFGTWTPIGDKATKRRAETTAVFREFSNGVKTNRDAWAFNFSEPELRSNIRTHVDHLNAERERVWAAIAAGDDRAPERILSADSTRGAWSRPNVADLKRNRATVIDVNGFRSAQYRPFTKQHMYLDGHAKLTEMLYRIPAMWPTAAHENLAIAVGTDQRKATLPHVVTAIPSLDYSGASQLFPRYTWATIGPEAGGFDFASLAEGAADVVDGYRRVDNITDATLDRYRAAVGEALPAEDTAAKDEIFYSVYALLHHPTYRETFAADLQKMLPRIPVVKGFADYARIGRELADLHVDYETVAPADLGEQITSIDPPTDPYELYRIDKLAWVSRKDHTAIRYNAHLTITGIPLKESEYKVGGRSPLEWVLDRYKVTVDKASGIVNDPNAWLREHENPRYVVDLIRSLVTVSLETQRLIAELPTFEVIE